MPRKSPEIQIIEMFPNPEEAKYPSLKVAQKAAKPFILDLLSATIKQMLNNGDLIIVDNEIVPNYKKIEKDKLELLRREKYKKENRKVFIYALIDPRNNEIKYVGQTVDLDRRLKAHISSGAPLIKKWIRELKEKNKTPLIKIIDETIGKKANFIETKWIKHFSKKFVLLNVTSNE